MNHQWLSVEQGAHKVPSHDAPPFGETRSWSPDTTAEVGDLWRILARRRRTVLAVTALFGLAALVYVALVPPLYTATAQILVDPRDRQVVTNDVNPSALGPDGGVTQVESQVRVIESDAVLARAVQATGLVADPEFGAPSTGLIARTFRPLLDTLGLTRSGDGPARAIRFLRRKLAVKRADKVFVIDVIVTTNGPDKSARIVNAIADAYLADQSGSRSDVAQRAAGELEARLKDLKSDLTKAETKLERFKAENGLLAASGRIVGEQQLTDSNARLTAARTRVAEARSRLQALRDARGRIVDRGALPEAIQSSTIDRLRSQYAELASKEADLRTQLGDKHPFVRAARTQRDEVKRLTDAELDRVVQATEIEYQRALSNEQTLTADLDTLKNELIERSTAAVQQRELEREADAARSVYNAFLLRSRELGEQAGVNPSNARVITWARAPEEKSWPLGFLIIGAGLAFGIGGGSALAFFQEYRRPTILSRRQCERLLGIPVLALLPGSERRASPDGPAAPEVSTALDTLFAFHEAAHRGTALSLLIGGPPSETKPSRMAIERFAVAATERGERVLIVDAVPGSANADPGLLEILRGDRLLGATVVTDPATGVRRIGLGRPGRTARASIDEGMLRRFLDESGRNFDLILFDCAAIRSTLRLGPIIAAVDGILAVARCGQTRQEDLIEFAKSVAAMRRSVTATLLFDDRVPG